MKTKRISLDHHIINGEESFNIELSKDNKILSLSFDNFSELKSYLSEEFKNIHIELNLIS